MVLLLLLIVQCFITQVCQFKSMQFNVIVLYVWYIYIYLKINQKYIISKFEIECLIYLPMVIFHVLIDLSHNYIILSINNH